MSQVLVYLHASSCVRFRLFGSQIPSVLTMLTSRVLLCAACVAGAPPVSLLLSPYLCSTTGIHSPHALRPDGCLPSLFLAVSVQHVLQTNISDPPCASMCAAIKSSMLDDFLNVSAGSVVHKKSNASSESEKMLLRASRHEVPLYRRISSVFLRVTPLQLVSVHRAPWLQMRQSCR